MKRRRLNPEKWEEMKRELALSLAEFTRNGGTLYNGVRPNRETTSPIQDLEEEKPKAA